MGTLLSPPAPPRGNHSHFPPPPVLTPVLSPTQDSDTEPLRSSKTHCEGRGGKNTLTPRGGDTPHPPQRAPRPPPPWGHRGATPFPCHPPGKVTPSCPHGTGGREGDPLHHSHCPPPHAGTTPTPLRHCHQTRDPLGGTWGHWFGLEWPDGSGQRGGGGGGHSGGGRGRRWWQPQAVPVPPSPQQAGGDGGPCGGVKGHSRGCPHHPWRGRARWQGGDAAAPPCPQVCRGVGEGGASP